MRQAFLRPLGALLLVLALSACEDENPGAPPKIKVQDDATPIGRVGATDAAPPTAIPSDTSRIRELRGTWTGEANTEEFGIVRARLIVASDGQVQSNLTGPMMNREDQFRVTSWDRKDLEVLWPDGTRLRVGASLAGDQLTIEFPQVGEQVLRREASGDDLK